MTIETKEEIKERFHRAVDKSAPDCHLTSVGCCIHREITDEERGLRFIDQAYDAGYEAGKADRETRIKELEELHKVASEQRAEAHRHIERLTADNERLEQGWMSAECNYRTADFMDDFDNCYHECEFSTQGTDFCPAVLGAVRGGKDD